MTAVTARIWGPPKRYDYVFDEIAANAVASGVVASSASALTKWWLIEGAEFSHDSVRLESPESRIDWRIMNVASGAANFRFDYPPEAADAAIDEAENWHKGYADGLLERPEIESVIPSFGVGQEQLKIIVRAPADMPAGLRGSLILRESLDASL